ncbi:MAG: hypothetical protein HQ570_02610 [Candidatus Omnitrophica bacterium]|nr:hypothetical protein [Candidatus Omnitrophota bacterium]
MRLQFLIISCLILFTISGCLFLPESVKTLKSVGDSQKEISAYLAKQLEFFNQLLVDLNNQLIKPGTPKKIFIGTYGEPILSKRVSEPSGGSRLLYRQPTEYFKSDRVYLYFDQEENLVRWEYKPKK